MLQKIKQGIRNWISWGKVIWEDRDYDYYYLLKILHHKISRMEKRWETRHDWAYEGQDKDLLNIMRVKDALERLVEDEYWTVANFEEESRRKQYDLDIVTETLNKEMFKWWD